MKNEITIQYIVEACNNGVWGTPAGRSSFGSRSDAERRLEGMKHPHKRIVKKTVTVEEVVVKGGGDG